ncbi:glycosyltransferase family 4 protein [Candidatus Methylocalor cossyra]|uniref:Glycosyltransferase involved in cell wall bisynthesis n=1 Tax=Candidatus Methylocalor cossyra TaxID=3108543 RepID=A0ABM9NKF7_9GAMM
MRIALISDAWRPQINGVVTTLTKTCEILSNLGHVVEAITPDRFPTWPCPSYPEIRLALHCSRKVESLLDEFKPEAIHIATEGPLGIAARSYCARRHLPFTTSFHTRFPEYVNLRFKVPLEWSYGYLRWFHSAGRRLMVATRSLMEELRAKGFGNLALWSRGVDTDLFCPGPKDFIGDKRPIFLYTGRIAVEKNIEDFLRLDLPGTKYVVGDGPLRADLEQDFPEVRFLGYKTGRELAAYLAAADVFVFPSRTDTFGLVVLEALACGVPVAAYPVQGPKDVLTDARAGRLNEDLRQAALEALALNGKDCRRFALQFTWTNCVRQFLANLEPF